MNTNLGNVNVSASDLPSGGLEKDLDPTKLLHAPRAEPLSKASVPDFFVTITEPKTFAALADVHSHYTSWRNIIESAIKNARADLDEDNATYFEHELKAYDRTFSQLQTIPLPGKN